MLCCRNVDTELFQRVATLDVLESKHVQQLNTQICEVKCMVCCRYVFACLFLLWMLDKDRSHVMSHIRYANNSFPDLKKLSNIFCISEHFQLFTTDTSLS